MQQQQQTGPCILRVLADYNPLAFVYTMFTPTITLDGAAQRRPWGAYVYKVSPGAHTVSVSYPWVLMRECGKNTVHVSLAPGQTCTVTYTARLTRYLPGKMTVDYSGERQ